MSVGYSVEHEQLRQSVRRFLAEKSPLSAVRRLMEAGVSRDDSVWRQLSRQLGLPGIAIPEEYGGSGYGPVELGIVAEEMGRALLVAPFFSTVVLAAQALVISGDEAAKRRWLPGIAAGELTATLAVAEESGSWDPESLTTTAIQNGGGWSLTGTKLFVVDGHTADLLLVVARTPDGPGVFAVEGDAAGVERARLDALDLTRPLASVSLRDAAAVRVGAGRDTVYRDTVYRDTVYRDTVYRDTVQWLAEAGDLVRAALAAEQVGGAGRCLDLAVEYAKVREQFGRPIGSFQAIKHKCAGLLVEVESGRSAAQAASAAVAGGHPDARVTAAVAHAYCSRVFTHAAKECIQIHGGIGYTWEHDAHLYLRRAKSDELLLGSPARERARLAELTGV